MFKNVIMSKKFHRKNNDNLNNQLRFYHNHINQSIKAFILVIKSITTRNVIQIMIIRLKTEIINKKTTITIINETIDIQQILF